MFPVLQELYINTIPSPVSFDKVDNENDTVKEDIEAFFGYVSRTKTFNIGIGSLDTDSLEHILRIASKQLQIWSIAINVSPHPTLSTFNISTSYKGSKDQQTTYAEEGKAICHVRITMADNQESENSCRSLWKVLAEDVNPRSIETENYEDDRMMNFKDLKSLRLSNMSLAMNASASPAVTKTLELEELGVSNCKIPALFFEQLSQRISYIKILNIGSIISRDFSSLNGLSMPYARLQTLRLDRNIKS
ncbi:unnamed protein product [Mucor fragilis]